MRPFILALTLLALLAPAPAHAQEVVLLPDPHARAVAVAWRFPAGSTTDPIGSEGLAFVHGLVLEGAATAAVRGVGAHVEVEVTREAFVLTLLAPVEGWEPAVRAVDGVFRSGAASDAAVAAAREEATSILLFESGSPVRSFERERDLLVFGLTSPVARPVHGTLDGVGGLTPAALEAHRTSHLTRGSLLAVITGPLDPPAVQAVLGTPVRTVALARSTTALPPVDTPGTAPSAATPTETLPPRPSTRGPGSAAPPLRVPTGETSRRSWDAPTRTVVDRELTSSWIAQAFPFPAGTPPLLLQFLGHLASESLNRTPPDPGLFETETEVVVVGGAPVLIVSASVDPFEAADWEGRLREAVVALGSAPPEGSFFDLTRRRFRSQVLLDLAAPESVVRWLAAEIAAGAEAPEDPEAQMWRLERDAVAEAARAAGPPRTLVFGPQGLTGP